MNFTNTVCLIKANLRPIPLLFKRFSQRKNNGMWKYRGEQGLLRISRIMLSRIGLANR